MTDRNPEDEAEALHRREIEAIDAIAHVRALRSETDSQRTNYAEVLREAAEEKRRLQDSGGDRAWSDYVADAELRYVKALCQHDDIRDPDESFTRAVGTEYATFRSEQRALQGEISAETDPEERRMLELRKEIEAAEYMALVSKRLANVDRVISDRGDSPQAALDEAGARAYNELASDLRREREALLYERATRDPALSGRDRTTNAPEAVADVGADEITDARARRLERLNNTQRQIERENRESDGEENSQTHDPGDRSH